MQPLLQTLQALIAPLLCHVAYAWLWVTLAATPGFQQALGEIAPAVLLHAVLWLGALAVGAALAVLVLVRLLNALYRPENRWSPAPSSNSQL